MKATSVDYFVSAFLYSSLLAENFSVYLCVSFAYLLHILLICLYLSVCTFSIYLSLLSVYSSVYMYLLLLSMTFQPRPLPPPPPRRPRRVCGRSNRLCACVSRRRRRGARRRRGKPGRATRFHPNWTRKKGN